MDTKALAKYLCALLLFVLTGIVLVNGRLAGAGNTWGLFCGAMIGELVKG